jgi:hypothetical protein
MNNKQILVEVLAQMIAPRLFVLSGDNPAEMGFPFADDENALEERLARQFNPVSFWTEKATEIAEAIVDVIFTDTIIPEITDAVVARSAAFAKKWQPSNS